MPPKITCWCCERENQSHKKAIEGHKVCGFCAKYLQAALDAGVPINEAKKEIMPVAQNMNPGKWPEKDLWSWNRTVNEKLTVEPKPVPAKDTKEKYQGNVAEEKAKAERLIEDLKQKYPTTSRQMDIVSDAGYSLLIPLTDRDHVLLKWIETLAVEQRRTREQQILWMLEVAMSQEAA